MHIYEAVPPAPHGFTPNNGLDSLIEDALIWLICIKTPLIV
jgi:hypothetical protein